MSTFKSLIGAVIVRMPKKVMAIKNTAKITATHILYAFFGISGNLTAAKVTATKANAKNISNPDLVTMLPEEYKNPAQNIHTAKMENSK
ncbi:MAG: hypothetical protein IJN59_05105 [Oscillospiraceae bacterium]|nr:hypothetical protein [Oscillospiraceae bacterium]